MADDLKARIEALTGTTTAARLRAVMPVIDRKVREGVKHEDIIEALEAARTQRHPQHLSLVLYRYRKHDAVRRAASAEHTAHATDGNSPRNVPICWKPSTAKRHPELDP